MLTGQENASTVTLHLFVAFWSSCFSKWYSIFRYAWFGLPLQCFLQ